jgi:hypothetical protein
MKTFNSTYIGGTLALWVHVFPTGLPQKTLYLSSQVPIADLANHMDDDEGEQRALFKARRCAHSTCSLFSSSVIAHPNRLSVG